MTLTRNQENAVAAEGVPPAPGLSDSDTSYYGWRVVLAACFGVMAAGSCIGSVASALFNSIRKSGGGVKPARACQR